MKQYLVCWLAAQFYNYSSSRDREAKVNFMNFGLTSPELGVDDVAAARALPVIAMNQ